MTCSTHDLRGMLKAAERRYRRLGRSRGAKTTYDGTGVQTLSDRAICDRMNWVSAYACQVREELAGRACVSRGSDDE